MRNPFDYLQDTRNQVWSRVKRSSFFRRFVDAFEVINGSLADERPGIMGYIWPFGHAFYSIYKFTDENEFLYPFSGWVYGVAAIANIPKLVLSTVSMIPASIGVLGLWLYRLPRSYRQEAKLQQTTIYDTKKEWHTERSFGYTTFTPNNIKTTSRLLAILQNSSANSISVSPCYLLQENTAETDRSLLPSCAKTIIYTDERDKSIDNDKNVRGIIIEDITSESTFFIPLNSENNKKGVRVMLKQNLGGFTKNLEGGSGCYSERFTAINNAVKKGLSF